MAVATNKRATLAFSGAGVLFVGVMLLDSHREPSVQPYAAQAASASPASFLAQRSAAPSATTVQSFWAPEAVKNLWNPQADDKDSLSLDDVRDIIQKWIAAAQARDVDAIVALYDEHVGRLLGTVDDASSPRRNSRELIRDYFNHFLGNHEKLLAIFPRFDAKDVQFIDDKTAVYSGYYSFELTPFGGETKIANAKFTYIVHRTLHDGVQLVLHNSGITPAGVVMKSSA
jgi:hypothetical protein